MKVLIKKYPINTTKPELNEAYPEALWHDWIDKDTGAPLTDENYGYALCDNCPNDFMDIVGDTDPTEMFEVKCYTKFIKDELGGVDKTERYWLATWIGTSQDPQREMEMEMEIAELKARLAVLEQGDL